VKKQLGLRFNFGIDMSDTTILIPVYDPTGSEKERLQRLVDSIVTQTSIPQRVILAANHKLDHFKSLTAKLQGVTTVDFQLNSSTGAAANLNQMIVGVTTNFTKIMFQDDFFTNTNSLSKIEDTLEKSKKSWVVSGCIHVYENEPTRSRTITPKFSRRLIKGINTIGAPSVVALRTENLEPFNEEMVYMFDCEWYLRMKHKFGSPAIVEEPLISIGIHSNQATHWAKNALSEEKSICRELHNVSFFTGKCSSCKSESRSHD
jgi:hypothetical protein